MKPKIVTIKEPIESEENILSVSRLSKEQFKKSLEKIQKLDKVEKDLNRRATALNNLESFVIDVQNKLYEDEYSEAATEEETEIIKQACSEVSDWLYEDGSEADADTYEKKLDEVQSLTKDLFARVWEHQERPEALKALHSMLNHSSVFLNTAKNFTESVNPENFAFKDNEVEALDKLISDTKAWKTKLVEEQSKLKKSEAPKLTVKLLMDKMAALDREVKYLVNKLKNFRPKKIEKPVEEKQDGGDNSTAEEVKPEEGEETIESPKESGKNDSSKKEKVKPSTTEKNGEKDSHAEL